jgi:hypothetical protein
VTLVLLEPAGMVADAGTCAADVRLLASEITAPDGGAAPLKVNVAIEDEPPVTVLGFNVSEVKAATETVRVVVLVFPYTPVRVTEVEAATPLVVILNVVLVLPAGIEILGGTWAEAVLLLCRVTVAPPVGAAPLNVTVPVALLPPTTELGLPLIEDRVAALTVKVVVRVTPKVPEIVTEVFAATGLVVMVKVALVVPPATVMVGGTCAADALLLCRLTTAPPAGAAPFKVTVPVELAPPTTVPGLREIEDKIAALTVRVVFRATPA